MSPKTYYLNLSFDVDQITKALHYDFRGPKGTTPFRREGPYAGTFFFNPGDEIVVCATATAKKSEEATFAITDFTFASIPTFPPGEIYLSLFDKHRASIGVSHWGVPERGMDAADVKDTITISALHPLVVIAPTGQWEMSGYLSAIIRKKRPDGSITEMSRLFYFDPESTSGSSGDIID